MSGIDGLNELVRDLTAEPGRVQRKVPAVIREGAQAVRDDWRQRASGLRHAPAYPRSITFDAGWKGATFEAEIGPDKGLTQGPLGNLLTFGSVNNPPRADDIAALKAEAPKVERALEGLIDL